MLLEKLTDWMEERGSCRMIKRKSRLTGEDEDYIKRFYVFRTKLISVFLHQVWADDEDAYHCHPWPNISWVLRGGYWETGVDDLSYWKGKGYKRYRSAEMFHRLTLGKARPGTTWTLFIHFKRIREWGFITPEGWLSAVVYGEKYGAPVESQGENDFKVVGTFFPRVVWNEK